ncbi:50S ribosomal protein L4 [Candidatus Kaiserbacteria bacterium RIFCSPHIGHO2_02_FULL_50_9]|uniref:Large ribosomal subunit protein uL4 n=1 Tax=Candidatus Kaiserbacteria bacterium RIFCSPLOWO2_01_FULL_51_21 TaxID=1798508 RepID=A0A1F6ECM7_9BACT|nr:MAG: 50S ribosomal protein L4 [Candidatus Kaiserbacteria bacterium RIFCSPHIGHO2_01_FULL_51_33]OGG63371.1 MAG: 50S ribosomal protein L4 [Candidatus Kaiserbacteria bacterium RIFCSPHIGHO2_02_FULL_50_9]OGG71429.1 MAG: 50S ribosomal protein L4 [Candidatus Kaiserbacteria bacterium RIFCSPLOWO2_01_FULL_51_21]
MEATIFNQQGKKVGMVALPERVFGAKWNPDLVHQVVVAMEANARVPIAHTKQRGEVRGGGRKPWQQKGTGRARHGSIRSPLWRGGGITFGPTKERVFAKGLNKKMRVQALFSALSRKLKDGEVLFVDSLSFSMPKAKEAKQALLALSGVSGFEKLASKKKNAVFIALPARNEAVEKSFRNFGTVEVGEVRNLNPRDVLKYTYVAIVDPQISLGLIAKRAALKK